MVRATHSWQDFKRRLGIVLRELPERTALIIGPPPEGFPFVQFISDQPDASLHAELCVADYPAPLVERLHQLGFVCNNDTINWARDIPFPSTDAIYDETLEACVLVLRDGHGISSPAVLHYECWRDPERMLPGVTYCPGDLDPGETGVRIPELGLEYQDFPHA